MKKEPLIYEIAVDIEVAVDIAVKSELLGGLQGFPSMILLPRVLFENLV